MENVNEACEHCGAPADWQNLKNVPLTHRILKLMSTPSTSHELAALMGVEHRLLYAALCHLKDTGKVKRISYMQSRRGSPTPIWGLA